MADAPRSSGSTPPASESPYADGASPQHAPGLEPADGTLEGILLESGHIPGPRLADFSALATTLMGQRRAEALTDSAGVTRPIALWVLARLDDQIDAALSTGLLGRSRLAQGLAIRQPPDPVAATSTPLSPHLARALRAYLAGRLPDQPDRASLPVGLPDLALAVLASLQADPSGFFDQPGVRIDLPRAIASVGALLLDRVGPLDGAPFPDRVGPLDGEEFSQTVRQVREELGGGGARATSGAVAQAITARHPEYGGTAGTALAWFPGNYAVAEVDDWLQRVRSLYDPARVRDSDHRVLDGRLVLLGLAELDPALGQDLAGGGFLARLRDEAQVHPRRLSMDHTEWTPDAPTPDDLLGRGRLAEALATRLRSLADPRRGASQSFIVHVDGPWGAGKSTLFELLAAELDRSADGTDRPLSPRFLVVRVNAWREQRLGVQWWTLLSALRRAIIRDAPWWRRPWLWVRSLADRVRAGWVPFAAAVLVLMGLVIWFVSLSGVDLSRSAAAADSVTKIVGALSVAFGGLVAATRLVLPGSRRSAQGFLETSDNPMDELGRLFARTLRRSHAPVVFLIDDLDRCEGDYVVRFLEAIQTLVRDAPRFVEETRRARARRTMPGPYAFVAADGQWLRTSYEEHYRAFSGTGGPGRPLGYLFLEKVFQLQVRLPAITGTAKAAFLASLLSRGRPERPPGEEQQALAASAREQIRSARSEQDLLEAAKQATDITDHRTRLEILGDVAVRFSERDVEARVEHALTRFGAYLEPNPRSMLLFVNAYGVLRQLRTLEEVLVDTEPLALWAVLDIRWPYLADYLRAHPEAVGEPMPDATPDDVRRLLGDPDIQAVLADRASQNPRPLSPELVRLCAGTAA